MISSTQRRWVAATCRRDSGTAELHGQRLFVASLKGSACVTEGTGLRSRITGVQ